MTTWERIRFDGKTVILRNPREIQFLGAPAISGIEVDREDGEIVSGGADERRRIIELALVTRRTRLVMSRTYGTLEESEEDAHAVAEFRRLLRNAEGQLYRRDSGKLTGRNGDASQDSLLYKIRKMNRLILDHEAVGAELDNNPQLAARFDRAERRAYGLPV